MPRPLRVHLLGTALLAVVLNACASAGAGATATPAAAGTSGPAATVGVATMAPATTPAASKSSGGAATVDLALTGWKSIAMQGTAGKCIGTAAAFGFQALEADYPGLGGGIYITEDNRGYVTIKWIPDPSTGFINIADITGAVSTDHRSITLDHDIKGGPGTEHIKGTITCP